MPEGLKITDKDFIDWENHYFGFGYGTGEQYTLPALKAFLAHCDGDTNEIYDYEVLEKELGPAVAWLLINILCHADIIEYGTSPRCGWLSKKGKMLKEYVDLKSVDDLYDLAATTDGDYTYCFPDSCQCGEKIIPEPCNPLFKR